MKKSLFVLSLSCFLGGCGFTAGTHGSLKTFSFPVKKAQLELIANQVILSKNNISKDNEISQYYLMEDSDGNIDTQYVVKDSAYVDIVIIYKEKSYNYTYRYSGCQQDWDSMSTSYISIAYAWDEKGRGGHQGDFSLYEGSLKRNLVSIFEQEFIRNIYKNLGLTHSFPSK